MDSRQAASYRRRFHGNRNGHCSILIDTLNAAFFIENSWAVVGSDVEFFKCVRNGMTPSNDKCQDLIMNIIYSFIYKIDIKMIYKDI